MSVARARHVPIRTALSGPAAGAVGAIHMAKLSGVPDVISLDMGGTSADVALMRDYTAGTTFNKWIEGYPARLASLDINAVGAGGGSIAWFDRDGLMKVGPQSAGAQPGPACYDRGGEAATVTDANLVLGRLSPVACSAATWRSTQRSPATRSRRSPQRLGFSVERTAHGMLGIVVANMVRAIRSVSVERGHDPRAFTLLPFGGAGPLHATDVAKSLGITRCLVPFAPGILCAQGLIVSDLRETFVRTAVTPLDEARMADVAARIGELKQQAAAWFDTEAVAPASRSIDLVLDARYVGQNFELAIGARRCRSAACRRRDRAALLRRARARLWLPQSGRPDRDRELPPAGGRKIAPARDAACRAAQVRQGRTCITSKGLVRGRCRAGHAGLRPCRPPPRRYHRGSGGDRAARFHHAAVPGRPRHRRSAPQPHGRIVT